MSIQKLLQTNVNEHVEKKNNLSYLSWAWAWAEALKADPAATYSIHLFDEYGADGRKRTVPYLNIHDTAMVMVTVTLFGKPMVCQLPVMDHRNKAISEPDAFAVNTAIMRCMTKALALHGLGLYIYAGEDIPEAEQTAAEKRQLELDELAQFLIASHEEGKDMPAIAAWYDQGNWAKDNPTEQEERQYVWGLLKPYSKLRASIKANNPHKEAA